MDNGLSEQQKLGQLVHAAYLTKGFLQTGPLSHQELAHYGGELSALAEVATFTRYLSTAATRAQGLGLEGPTVFEYEISEGMGAWLRCNHLADAAAFQVELVTRLTRHFGRHHPGLVDLQAAASQPPACPPPDWTPSFSPWRHGGWYVDNVQYASGAIGCVSRNYEDRKWRIVCDPRREALGSPGDFTFGSRLEAARVEYVLAAQSEQASGGTIQ